MFTHDKIIDRRCRGFAQLFSVAILLIFVMCLNSAMAQTQEQTLTRVISYDPHPSSAFFAQTVPYNNELLYHEVVFHETWKSLHDSYVLTRIFFTIRALKGSSIVVSASTKPFDLNGVSKDQQIGLTTLGSNNFVATAIDFVKIGTSTTDLSVTFKITYPEVKLELAVEAEANLKTDNALKFCNKLASKADALPVDHISARLSLYRKALLVAPSPESSPEAEKFQDRISAIIAELESAPKDLIQLGDTAYENRKYGVAKATYDRLLNLNDADADLLLKYFKSCYYLGEGSEAILRLNAVKNRYPANERILLAVAEAYFQLGDLISAQSHCNDALNANPSSVKGKELLQRLNKLLNK